MSQRNPMNDRYQTDDKKGQTRKSAAEAKPKTKAASSVHIQSTTKTPQQKKAAARAKRQETAELDRKYYNPPTPEYKKWKRVWWVLIIVAIAATAFSIGLNYLIGGDQTLVMPFLGVGYACLIAAFILDLTKIKKIRRQYQAEMQAKITKEARAQAKKEHAAALAAKKSAAEKAKEEGSVPEAPAKKGILSFFSFLNLKDAAQRASQANKAAAREAAATAAEGAGGTDDAGKAKKQKA